MNSFAALLESLEACPTGQEDAWVQEHLSELNTALHLYIRQEAFSAHEAKDEERAERLARWFHLLKPSIDRRVMQEYLQVQQHYVLTQQAWLFTQSANAELQAWENSLAVPDYRPRRQLIGQALQLWLDATPQDKPELLQQHWPFLLDQLAESVLDELAGTSEGRAVLAQQGPALRQILSRARPGAQQQLWRIAKDEQESRASQLLAIRSLVRLSVQDEERALFLSLLGQLLGQPYATSEAGTQEPAGLLEAIACFEQSIALPLSEANRYSRPHTLRRLGDAYVWLRVGSRAANLQQALARYEQARQELAHTEYQHEWAVATMHQGYAYARLPSGNQQQHQHQAIELYQQALQVFRQVGDRGLQGAALNNLGNAHFSLQGGEPGAYTRQGIDYQLQALGFLTESEDDLTWANVQNDLGAAYAKLARQTDDDDLSQSIEHLQLALRVRDRVRYPMLWATTTHNLGAAYLARAEADDLEKAIACFEQVLHVRQPAVLPEPWARTMHNLATAHAEYARLPRPAPQQRRHLDESVAAYQRALQVLTPMAFPVQCRDVALSLGRLLLREQRYEEALTALQLAEQAIGNIWLDTHQAADKELLAQENAEVYLGLVTCCLHGSDLPAAFRYAATAKGRAFVDGLHTGYRDLEEVTDADPKADFSRQLATLRQVRQQVQGIQQLLRGDAGGATDQRATLDTGELSPRQAAASQEALRHQLPTLYKQLRQLQEQLARRYPQQFATQVAPTLTSAEAQQLAARLGAPLVEYYCHAEGWVAFVVLADRLVVEHLPAAADALDALHRWPDEIERQPVWSAWQTTANAAKLQALAEAFVWPLLPHLPAGGPLVLAPNQALHGLPLQAAPLPGDALLADRFALSFLPSLSALAVRLRQQAVDGLPISRPGPPSLLAVSCPGRTRPLLHVEAEAEAVAACFNPAQTTRLREQAGQATVKQVIAACEQGPTVIYAGCHGQFLPAFPEQSGLRLQDGTLHVEQILTELPLRGVELVVLAACQSGQAHVGDGDELVGLPQALLLVGAGAVLASHWAVADEPTRVLITAFFRGWQQGLPPAQALQQAMRTVRAHPHWAHPYYWSPFRLIGVLPATHLAFPAFTY